MKFVVSVALVATICTCQSGCRRAAAGASNGKIAERAATRHAVPPAADTDPVSYSGTDSRGIPHYLRRSFTDDERAIFRRAFGVVNPSHLYISDSTEDGLLKYDPEVKQCAACYVNSFRVGFISVRRPGESWDDLERRVRAMNRSSFPRQSLVSSRSLTMLDPDILQEVRDMLGAAGRAGFRLHVGSTYRSPEQEALLMSAGGGRTHTLTSLHSYGRAIDITVGDGNLGNRRTRAEWIAFRRWVTRYRGNDFRVLGSPDRTWDWPHVELPSNRIGFRNVEQALAAGRVCLKASAPASCEFKPHLHPPTD